MSTNRGGRPVTHGTRWLAVRLEHNRLEPRLRRLLNRLHTELAASPLDTVRGLLIARYARKELVAQQGEAHLLADPDATPSKWLLGLWNSMRRDVELLALLERDADKPDDGTLCDRCDARFDDLQGYLQHPCRTPGTGTGQPTTAASAASAVEAEKSAAGDGATEATQR